MQTIYTSAALCRHFETFNAISDALAKADINHHCIAGTDNFWCRDYMPIPTKSRPVKFKYDAYGYRRFAHMKVPDTCWNHLDHTTSNIFLDGGNVEQSDSKVLICEMVFRKNRNMPKLKLAKHLEMIFQKEIVFLPCEPGDTLGHADGLARFSTDNRVLVNDYDCMGSKALTSFQSKLDRVLSKAGLEAVRMPYAYDECPHLSKRQFKKRYPYSDDQNEATGYYINFLALPSIVLVPQFGLSRDDDALEFLKTEFHNRKVVGIPCFEVSQLGGCCNCVTYGNSN